MSATLYNTSGLKKQVSTSIPGFQFSVLTCVSRSKTATKTIYPNKEPKPYDSVKYWFFEYKEIDCLEDFAKIALTWLATEPRRCIIRGQLKQGFDCTKRQRRLVHSKDGEPATLTCPKRRWIVLDCDNTPVPSPLHHPDKVAEAGYFVRDRLLPSYFRGVRCISAASPSAGRKETAHLRMYFVLREAAENDALRAWVTGLSEKYLFIDPKVMEMQQPIYTARPLFHGCADPVPDWSRVTLLDGYEDELEFELPRGWKPKSHRAEWPPEKSSLSVPDELLEITAQDAGLGVPPLPTDISMKAWKGIREFFDACDGCPKNGIGRHETLNRGAWQLARLVAECELPEPLAREAYWAAVTGINNGDGKYGVELLQRHIDDAFNDVELSPEISSKNG